jgi:predicted DNA binding CopG/RHH family protein
VLDIGEKEKKFMNKSVNYTDEPIGAIKIIEDFLPSPSQLVTKDETVKVTLSLTKESVNFFKQIAKDQHTHYQTMIRLLLDKYAEHYRN